MLPKTTLKAKLRNAANAVKSDVADVKQDVAAFTLDMSKLSSRVAGISLGMGFATLKQDVVGLKRGMGAITRHFGIEETGES